MTRPADRRPAMPNPGTDRRRARVLIVDDNAGFRTLAGQLLTEYGFDVVAEAGDAMQALAEFARSHPSIVLLDVQLPDLNGFEVARLLAEQEEPPRVILTSTRDRSAYRRRLAELPACRFIPKAELSGSALSDLVS
jgi:DNA-binding NarL/FixJ family response regulator